MSGSRHTPLRVAFARPWPGTRRGFKLWLFALVIGARGLIYALGDSASQALQFPFPWVTAQAWGLLVVAVCAGAVWSSYCHHGRDRYGYAAMSALAVLWAFLYVYGYLTSTASPSAVQGALSFVLISVLLIHCAGDPELPTWTRGRRSGES